MFRKMHGNSSFINKGMGGLHDTFRVMNRRKMGVYKQPVVEARDIIDVGVANIKTTIRVKKRKPRTTRVKTSYKKSRSSKKPALRPSKQRSDKVRKGSVKGGRKTVQSVRKRKPNVKKARVNCVKDRF